MPCTGIVKNFFEEKGFGFISNDEDGTDYFVHANSIHSEDDKKVLGPGEKVEFDLEADERSGKLCAVNVTGPDGAPVTGVSPEGYVPKGQGRRQGQGRAGERWHPAHRDSLEVA